MVELRVAAEMEKEKVESATGVVVLLMPASRRWGGVTRQTDRGVAGDVVWQGRRRALSGAGALPWSR